MTDRALYALLAKRYGDGTDLRRTDTCVVTAIDTDLFTGRTDIKVLDLRSFNIGLYTSVANPYNYRTPLIDSATAGKGTTGVTEVYLNQPNLPFVAYQLYTTAADPVIRLTHFWLTCRYLQGRPDDGTRIKADYVYLNIAAWNACSSDFDTNVKAGVLILDTEITRDYQSQQSTPLTDTAVYVRDDQLTAARGYAKLSSAKTLRPMSQFNADYPSEADWWK